MLTTSEILNKILDYTNETKNSLAIKIGLLRSQNLYDIEKGKVKRISSDLSEKIIAKYPNINREWILTGIGEMLLDDTKNDSSYNEKRLKLKNGDSEKGVPVYNVEFTAGFIELIKDGVNNLIGHINLPEFKGCDAVVTCRNNSMSDVINPNDWVGIRRIYDMEDIEYGAIYGVVTKNFSLFKYLFKCEADESKWTLRSENASYNERDIPISKVLELWVVQASAPFSKIKVYI